ncbi:MAG: HEPN domain-containing protein [Dehalococcoidia bacterium]|nr:HEPN domain-containing protein [Dehalococcoidia bacterium]
MTTQTILAEMTDRIVREFHPVRIVLFGSQARGDARPWSDFDLLVVLRECADKRQMMMDIGEALSDIRVSKDIIVTTPDEIARRGDLIGSILRPALREGVVLYDCGVQELRIAMSAEEIAKDTRYWMRLALDDVTLAERALEGGRPLVGLACYHAQQAVEKAIKAVLIFLQIEFPFTHEIDPLLKLVPSDWGVKEAPISGRSLNDWAIAGRYPVTDLPEPVEENAWEALRQARAVLEAVESDLKARGLDRAAQ